MTVFKQFIIVSFAGVVGAACSDDKSSEKVNTPPIADAGASQTLSTDDPVRLSGSGSYDPDGDPLTYTWAFDSVPEGSSLLTTSFTSNESTDPDTNFIPDAIGTYVVQLVVTDTNTAASTPDRTLITIVGGEAPLANAGDDQAGLTGTGISLNGSGSTDPMERALTYSWTFATVPETSEIATFSPSDSVSTSFTPDVSGMYVAALIVNNGLSNSAPDTAVIRVSASDASPPVAAAGDDTSGEDCTLITVDGSASSDPDGESLQYFWDLQSKPAGSTTNGDNFADRTAATTTFFPDIAGEYVLSLAVFDGMSWSAPDLMTLTVDERSYNGVPSVYPGAPQSMDAGETICEEVGYSYICAYCDPVAIELGKDAIVRDADADTITVAWEVLSGAATIVDPTSLVTEASMTSSQPIEPGACETNEYTFQLTATDCTGASASQTVTHHAICCGITSGGDTDSAIDSGADTDGGTSDPTDPTDPEPGPDEEIESTPAP